MLGSVYGAYPRFGREAYETDGRCWCVQWVGAPIQASCGIVSAASKNNGRVTAVFKKGDPRPAGAGRRPGQANRTSAYLRAAILSSAEAVGWPKWDPKRRKFVKGKGGLQAYLEWLAIHEPKSFTTLIARVLPLQLTGDDGGPIKFQPIPPGASPSSAAQMYAEALKAVPPPNMIDITPESKAPAKGSLPRVIPGRSRELVPSPR